MALSHLRQQVSLALVSASEPWFPGLASSLTAAVWRQVADRGFDQASYGTYRWLRRDPEGERRELAAIDLGDGLACRIEALPAAARVRYARHGLVFCAPDSAANSATRFRAALQRIGAVPSLYSTIAVYLRSLHVLQSPGAAIDVSHSDPAVPFSIFLSVPPDGQNGLLRLTESIVHECMHLQLTLIEAELPLVGAANAMAFSPWQQCARPLSGLLHGLYVFAVIDAFFEAMDRSQMLSPCETTFIGKRHEEITREVALVDHLSTAEALTDAGRGLARQLLRRLRRSCTISPVSRHGAEPGSR
jgi:HEXXH motif-containing protein